MEHRSWVEIDAVALRKNVRSIQRIIGDGHIFCAVVKANAYGHGLREVAGLLEHDRTFREGWFGVDSLPEAQTLRNLHIRRPILILGYVPITDARAAVRTSARITVATPETVHALASAARALHRNTIIHVKVETGTQRQGILPHELPAIIRMIERSPSLTLEGISTHLADVEDTGANGFAVLQLDRFNQATAVAERIVHRRLLHHTSASAAAMLFPDARFDLFRPGIALYGLWPSDRIRATMERRSPTFRLSPVLSWKTIVGPMHTVPKGAPVGYGCTECVRRRTRIAVLPIGYWDGYDRKLSSAGEVLIRGRRCKVVGRVCMNMLIVDVTDVPRVRLEDEVTMIGRIGRASITADDLANRIGTINYEIVTRINPLLPRVVV